MYRSNHKLVENTGVNVYAFGCILSVQYEKITGQLWLTTVTIANEKRNITQIFVDRNSNMGVKMIKLRRSFIIELLHKKWNRGNLSPLWESLNNC